MKTFFQIVFFIMLLVSPLSFANESKQINKKAFDIFDSYLEKREYHNAYLVLDEMLEEMVSVGEGASVYEYNRLIGMTAGSGHGDWEKIFRDPKISLERKIDLVTEIHTIASTEIIEENGKGDNSGDSI